MAKLIFVLMVFGCAGGDELGGEVEQLEQEQRDCRPVCDPKCYDFWNVRACCHVPLECAAEPEPEPPSL